MTPFAFDTEANPLRSGEGEIVAGVVLHIYRRKSCRLSESPRGLRH